MTETRAERRLRELDEEEARVEAMYPNDLLAQYKYWADKARMALERLKDEKRTVH